MGHITCIGGPWPFTDIAVLNISTQLYCPHIVQPRHKRKMCCQMFSAVQQLCNLPHECQITLCELNYFWRKRHWNSWKTFQTKCFRDLAKEILIGFICFFRLIMEQVMTFVFSLIFPVDLLGLKAPFLPFFHFPIITPLTSPFHHFVDSLASGA